MTEENVLIKITTCQDKQEKNYHGMIYSYENCGIKEYVSIYIFDINLKVEDVAFYVGQYTQLLSGKKIIKHLQLQNDISIYCEINIV